MSINPLFQRKKSFPHCLLSNSLFGRLSRLRFNAVDEKMRCESGMRPFDVSLFGMFAVTGIV